jgi:CYTH domain-containing protein
MASEIERKFLLKDKSVLKDAIEKLDIKQSYISVTAKQTTRVRLLRDESGDKKAWMTVKSKKLPDSIERQEFEYEIPYKEAREMFKMGMSYVSKERYIIPYKDDSELKWEVDVFKDANKGLIVVEIEIPSEDYDLKLPSWLGKEVTNDSDFNSNRKLSLNNIKNCKQTKKDVEKTLKKNARISNLVSPR